MILQLSPLQGGADPKAVVGLLVMIIVGLAMVYFGFKNYRIGRLIKNTPAEKVRSAAVGRTELHGRAIPKDFVFDEPFTDGKCLYADITVKEYREYDDDDKDDKWVTIFSRTFTPPFYLDDGTGEMLVDADSGTKFEIGDENTYQTTVRKRSEPPENVQDFLGGTEGKAAETGTDISEAMTDILGGVRDKVTDSGQAAKTMEQAQADAEAEGGTTEHEGSPAAVAGQEAAGSSMDTDTARENAGPAGSDELDVEYVTRGQMNTNNDILSADQPSAADDERDGSKEGGSREASKSEASDEAEESGIVGTITGAASKVSDAIETASGPMAVSPTSRHKRRYKHEVLSVGEEAMVFGAAEPRDVEVSTANEDHLVMRTDPMTDQFIVSDRGEETIAWGYTKRAIIFILIGLAVSAAGVGILANLVL